jgi:alkyl hydroperoxide reductase subunit AhpC
MLLIANCFSLATVKQQAPYWEANVVEAGQIKKITAKDLLGSYTILLFYPLDLYLMHCEESYIYA